MKQNNKFKKNTALIRKPAKTHQIYTYSTPDPLSNLVDYHTTKT